MPPTPPRASLRPPSVAPLAALPTERGPCRAVLLVAGQGTRMGALTRGLPKSFLEVGAEALIERTLRLLRGAGIEDITLVTGFREGLFRSRFPRCRFVRNPAYSRTNTARSLELALRPEESASVLVVNGDVYLEEGLIEALLEAPHASVAAVRRGALGDEEVKVLVEGERVRRIGKALDPRLAFGEAFGLYLLAPDFARALKETLGGIEDAQAFYELGMDRWIAERGALHVLDIGAALGMELDDPGDYRALMEILRRRASGERS